jgi:hypothetical protein
MKEASTAIREARVGRVPIPEMLRSILAAQVLVPLAAPPVLEGNSVKSWRPATLTKQDGGAQFLVAFTDTSLADNFFRSSPEHTYGFLVDVQWLLSALPKDHGIVFNIGDSEINFEWSADGISEYQQDRGNHPS